MKKFLSVLALLLGVMGLGARAADESAALAKASEAMEQQVRELVASPEVTVVHFWAPWCPNCTAEMDSQAGWAKFIADNPGVKFVFLNIWHRDQNPQPKLTAAGLGAQPNLTLLTHPNAASRANAGRMETFLGMPVTWIPTTWVFRDGKLRVAFNYGEIRFPILQQMIDDSTSAWKH